MKRLVLLPILASSLFAQATVYLRASGPAAVQVMGASNAGASPMQICTGQAIIGGTYNCQGTPLNHSFPTTCGTTTTCYCQVSGLAVDSGNHASMGNGIKQCHYVDATHLSLYDLSGNPITANGNWYDGDNPGDGVLAGVQTVSLLTQFTTNAAPTGWLDGPNGDTMRRFALGPQNGLASLVVTGAPSAAVITVTTTYDPTTGNFPIAVGGSFSVNGTGTALDTCGLGGGAQSPYMVASASSSGWVSTSFTCPGLTNGNYASVNKICGPPATPNDTIGGTQSCTRVSQIATTANPWWTGMVATLNAQNMAAYPDYKLWFDGGKVPLSIEWAGDYQIVALEFLLNQSNSFWLAELLYVLNHIEREDGVNWSLTESQGGGGGYTGQLGGLSPLGISLMYATTYPYWSASEEATFRAKIYNNLNDPSVPACNKSGDIDGNDNILSSGVATGGDATHLTLQSDPALASLVNNVIQLGTVGASYTYAYGIITAYNSSTKVATIGGGWVGSCYSPNPCVPPAIANPPYTIFASITVGSTASGVSGATTTITGYNTRFTTSSHVGDAIIGTNNLGDTGYEGFYYAESYVQAINSDTSLTVINGQFVSASTTVPSIAYYLPKWQAPNDCGRVWAQQHAPGFPGSQPIVQLPWGGTNTVSNGGPGSGGNTAWIMSQGSIALDLAVAAATGGSEIRAVSDLALNQANMFDYTVRFYMNEFTGFGQSGATYEMDSIQGGINLYLYNLTQSVPGYPSMDQTGPWATNAIYNHMYGQYPDSTDGDIWFLQYTNQSSHPSITGAFDAVNVGLTLQPVFSYWPATCATTPNCPSQYYRNYLENAAPNYNKYGYPGVIEEYAAIQVLHNSPAIASTNYKTQPLQFVFNTSSAVRCAALTGWPCPANFRSDAMISRSGWNSQADTLVYHGSRTAYSDYYGPESTLGIYKVGWLLYDDSATPGELGTGVNMSVLGDTPSIGTYPATFVAGAGANVYGGQPGEIPIYAWAGSNHGAWPISYGDQNSTYAYDCSDISGNYDQATLAISIDWMHRCIVHFKKSGADEFVLDFHSYSASKTPALMEFHLHYPNNGQTESNPSRVMGATTYLGGNVIQSIESGGTVGSAPAQTYGLMSYIYSPGTVTLNDDCAGLAGGQCSPSSTYSGGLGYTHRFTVAGGPSVGAPVAGMDVIAAHKVMTSLTDTTIIKTPLNPDTNWTGLQLTGSNSSVVALFARGGATHSTITDFTTTHSGTAQYLFGGLTAGVYTVTVGGTAVPGSPFTVSDNDNSIEFENSSGTLSIRSMGGSSISSTTISGQTTASGNVIIR